MLASVLCVDVKLVAIIVVALESGCLAVAGASTQASSIMSLTRRCTVWSTLDTANEHNYPLTRCFCLCICQSFAKISNCIHSSLLR